MNDAKIATVDVIYNSRDLPMKIIQHAVASANLNLVTDPFRLLLSASPNVIDEQDEIIYRLQFYSYSTNSLYGIHIHDEICQGLAFLNQSSLYINGQHSDQLKVYSHENQVDFVINENISSGDYVEIQFIVRNVSMEIGDIAENQVELIHEHLINPVFSNKVDTEYQTARLQGKLQCIDQLGHNIDCVKTGQSFYYMLEMNNVGNCPVHMSTWGITVSLPKGYEFCYDRGDRLPCILLGKSPLPYHAFPCSSNVQVSIINEVDNYVLSMKHLTISAHKKIYLFIKGFYKLQSIYEMKKNKISIKYEYDLERSAYCKMIKECFVNETRLKVYNSEVQSNNWIYRGITYITEKIDYPNNWTNVGLMRYDTKYLVDYNEIIIHKGIRYLRIHGYSNSTITYLLNDEIISSVSPFQIDLPNYNDGVPEIELLPCRYHLGKSNGCTVRIRSSICIRSYSV